MASNAAGKCRTWAGGRVEGAVWRSLSGLSPASVDLGADDCGCGCLRILGADDSSSSGSFSIQGVCPSLEGSLLLQKILAATVNIDCGPLQCLAGSSLGRLPTQMACFVCAGTASHSWESQGRIGAVAKESECCPGRKPMSQLAFQKAQGQHSGQLLILIASIARLLGKAC